MGSFLGAWVLFPLVLLLCSWGCGLLVRRISGGTLSAGLIVPVGFALVLVVCTFFTSFSSLAPAAAPIAAALAALGLALEARSRSLRLSAVRSSAWVWPALAALAAFAAVGGPVFLTGNVGWTGYTRIVDIAFQMDIAQHLAQAGRAVAPNQGSSYNVVINKLLGVGYPGGSQATLGSFSVMSGTSVAWCYQAFLACVAAVGALAIYSILGRLTRNPLLRCVGAAIAIQPNLLYGYALEAGIKELTAAALLLTLVAVLAERLPGAGRPREVVPAAVAVAASFAAFSFGILPWLGLLLVGLFVVTIVSHSRRRRKTVGAWAVLLATAVVISLPSVTSAAKLLTLAGNAVGGVVNLGLGNLAAPVPDWSSAGVWLTGDYRFPLAHVTATHAFDVVAIALAVLGIVVAFRRRRFAPAMLGLIAPVALYYWMAHTGPWLELKAYVITSAITLTLAFVGIAALSSMRWRPAAWLAWLGAIALGGVVLYGNAITYHDTTLAPSARYRNLAEIGRRYAGQGPTLDPSFDEYAEYFLRAERGSSLVDPANLKMEVRPGVPSPPGGVSFTWDLNQLVPSFLQSFHLIVQPRSPVASRAPANYDLIERTRYFDVWRRDRPASDVVADFPLSSLPHERTRHFCRHLVAVARHAGPGAQVAYAQSAAAIVASPAQGVHPAYWPDSGSTVVIAQGAGSDTMQVSVPQAGRYGIWLNGSVGRSLTVYVDGRRISRVGYEERYPDQFLLLARATLSAGSHTLRIVRGNGTLHPGSGDPSTETAARTIGAIVFERESSDPEPVYVAPAAKAAQVCAAPVGYEWLEVLRRGGAPAGALPAKL